jgi:hypothetical protein
VIDFGIVKPGSTLYVPFSSTDGSGGSVTLTGLAVTDIEIYKDGGTTQRASDNGYTLLDTDGIDFDGITGIHGFSISLADNTTAGFYAAGSDYFVVVSTVTVDAQTVSFLACRFRIGYPAAILNTTIATLSSQTSFTLTAGPAEDDALNGCVIAIHDVASAVQVGQAYILDYTGSTKTVTLAAGTTFTAATTDNVSVFPRSDLAYIIGENQGARFLRAAKSITTGSITTGSSTTSIVTTGLSPAASVTDQFKGCILQFTDDTTTASLRGQKTDITASTSGGVLTVTALTTAPASGDTFSIN